MIIDKREQFLKSVEIYIEEDPGVVPHLFKTAEYSLLKGLDKANQRAADMECALLAAVSKKYPKADAKELIIDKIKAQSGKTALRWDWLLKELEKNDN